MKRQKIEDIISGELPVEDRKTALDFVGYLRESGMEFVRGQGCWKDKIYYQVSFQGEYVCYIAIRDPDEPENRWTVWSDDMASDCPGDSPVGKELRETAWKHIDFCSACGSCSGGRRRMVFGKAFENVCGCTFRFDNPNAGELPFMKKMVEIRKSGLL